MLRPKVYYYPPVFLGQVPASVPSSPTPEQQVSDQLKQLQQQGLDKQSMPAISNLLENVQRTQIVRGVIIGSIAGALSKVTGGQFWIPFVVGTIAGYATGLVKEAPAATTPILLPSGAPGIPQNIPQNIPQQPQPQQPVQQQQKKLPSYPFPNPNE